MATSFDLERVRVSKIIMEEMFQVKPGETVAITADSGSDRETVDAMAAAAYAAGGIPLVMWMPRAVYDGQAGMSFWPSKALTAALCEVDIWIEAQATVILYSDIWETAMAKNKKLRYLIIAASTIESLVRVFASFDIQVLKEFLHKVLDMSFAASRVRVFSDNGTDVSYDLDHSYFFDLDDGDYSMPKFGTAPGFVNLVPKLGSMNGKIVFDSLQNTDILNSDNNVEFVMKKGVIDEINGNKEAENFKKFLAAFEDENMYKISHNMFGLNPGVRQLCGLMVEDERVWGGVDFGFGHTSPMDMPPNGQVAKSHFDGVVENVSIFLDDMQIFDHGVVCHPDLKPLADKLLAQ
jgi:leucyl aminopeptidase (aminopeptidase T)